MARKVTIKNLQVAMEVKTNGVEFDVSDGGHVGDLYVTKTGLTWCEGKTSKANGRRITWKELQDFCKEKG